SLMLNKLPTKLELSNTDVHVWSAALNVLNLKLEALTDILSVDERARADRFHLEQHRRRFIVARATLRLLLSKYLEVPPKQLVFSYQAHGKPMLAVNPDGV